MASKYLCCLLCLLISTASCFHLHIVKVPKVYVNDVELNINELTPIILDNYKTNESIWVDSIINNKLKAKLKSLKIDYLSVTYIFDSTLSRPYQIRNINPEKYDSLIIYGHSKNLRHLNFDTWGTQNEVGYYFGRRKPKIKSFKDEFSNLTRKINDSVYFIRSHYPNK